MFQGKIFFFFKLTLKGAPYTDSPPSPVSVGSPP